MTHEFTSQMPILADLREMERPSFLILEKKQPRLRGGLDLQFLGQCHRFDLDRLSLPYFSASAGAFFRRTSGDGLKANRRLLFLPVVAALVIENDCCRG
jgi:hypothetical protein